MLGLICRLLRTLLQESLGPNPKTNFTTDSLQAWNKAWFLMFSLQRKKRKKQWRWKNNLKSSILSSPSIFYNVFICYLSVAPPTPSPKRYLHLTVHMVCACSYVGITSLVGRKQLKSRKDGKGGSRSLDPHAGAVLASGHLSWQQVNT